MKNGIPLLLLAISLSVFSAPSFARFIFRMGDAVYVDGKKYSADEWEKIKNNLPDAEPQPGVADNKNKPEAKTTTDAGARAATCRTIKMYDEFPDDNEKLSCNANLGQLTREEILKMGWKIDLTEKIPAPSGTPAISSRGLPLNSYKLILSR